MCFINTFILLSFLLLITKLLVYAIIDKTYNILSKTYFYRITAFYASHLYFFYSVTLTKIEIKQIFFAEISAWEPVPFFPPAPALGSG